jgi:hypothetical protein
MRMAARACIALVAMHCTRGHAAYAVRTSSRHSTHLIAPPRHTISPVPHITSPPWRICACAGLAEEALQAASAGAHGSSLSVGEAITTLRELRASLVDQLTPADAYVLAKRSLWHQLTVRSAVELLERAPGGRPCKRKRAT